MNRVFCTPLVHKRRKGKNPAAGDAEQQRNAVREMGFRPLLHFSLIDLPGNLAYWIVLNLHIASSSIKLAGNQPLHIDAEDVHVTLGFPKGSMPIRRKERLEGHPYADGIADRIGKDRAQLLDIDVENEMFAYAEGGINIKKCFLISMETALIETP
ncbi:hypothetical protein SASPL_157326 [Salvia splendens]|uniref:Uncharacterized protein n=1 Tax=Salvia splendens TaxID=180675 RepID=A0A8X8VV34_SALSN|nr:hypothetical protein SASPL_157326 [Salvia splendens]